MIRKVRDIQLFLPDGHRRLPRGIHQRAAHLAHVPFRNLPVGNADQNFLFHSGYFVEIENIRNI